MELRISQALARHLGLLRKRVVGFECPEDAEIVAFGVGHDDPSHCVTLTDIDSTGTKSFCSRNLKRLVVMAEVNVESVLDLFRLRDRMKMTAAALIRGGDVPARQGPLRARVET